MEDGMAYEDLTTDWYTDRTGRRWMCVRQKEAMNCRCEDGCYTSAYLRTFVQWGWKKQSINDGDRTT
jgi:hypothetical protein